MDDADIADTVIAPRRTDAPSPRPTPGDGLLSAEPDGAETLLRSPVALIEPADERAPAPPPPSPSSTPGGSPARESHAATLAPVPPTEQQAARYRYRINGGAVVDLDVVTLVGRSPREPRVPAQDRPALIAVESPEREVSGTHVELKQYGASIVVTDMRSTNGTRIVMPGAAPVVLRPGESIVAVPGAVIDIGDGNLIEILPMRRFVPDSADFDRLLP